MMVIKHCGFDKRFALLHFYIGERTPQTLPVASLLRSFETTAVRLRRGDSGNAESELLTGAACCAEGPGEGSPQYYDVQTLAYAL
jgi:hypothetical protein